MRDPIDDLLSRNGQAATRAQLLTVVSRSGLDDEVRRRHLTRVFARTYARPWEADQPDVVDRAALLSVGYPVVLSHRTALARHGLIERSGPVHVTVPADRAPTRQPGLVVHRSAVTPPMALLAGLPTVTVASAAVTSWPLHDPAARRAVVIEAVRRRLASTASLRVELERRSRLRDRRELRALIGLLDNGCQSELEIWGLLNVFDAPGLRHGVRQRWIRVAGRSYVLDLAYEAERVCVELDGDAFHSTREQRERDRRRDAALASIGWLTLRFTYRRLHDDVAGCRHDTLATLASRRERIQR